jgi:hypothetical protein
LCPEKWFSPGRRSRVPPLHSAGRAGEFRRAVASWVGASPLFHQASLGEPGVATAQQLKALLQSYSEADGEMFVSVALQIAAHEARTGKGRFTARLNGSSMISRRSSGRRKSAVRCQSSVPAANWRRSHARRIRIRSLPSWCLLPSSGTRWQWSFGSIANMQNCPNCTR